MSKPIMTERGEVQLEYVKYAIHQYLSYKATSRQPFCLNEE